MTDDMALPPGKSCGDCGGWLRCKSFIGSLRPTNTRCDWSPSAFWEPKATSAVGTSAPEAKPATDATSNGETA